jgi:pimeloyl-ACP methyl ester carboxylesterase
LCNRSLVSRATVSFLACAIACSRASDARPVLPDTLDAQRARPLPTPSLAPEPPDASISLPPLPPDPLFTNLSVPGFPEPVVSVPNGATSPRPVIIVLHGSGDRPDYNCDAWRHITQARGFVLCPRGDYVPQESTKDDARYTLRGGARLRRYVDSALEALGARFAGYADVERPVVAGFSLGATEIAQLAVGDPARFSRVALVEGGHGVWTPDAIHAFASAGGLRVLFACGSPWCVPLAGATKGRLEKGGVEARAVHANVGHTNDRPLQEAIMGEIGWFLQGDSRWGDAQEQ